MNKELSNLIQEYVVETQGLIESLMSKKAYAVDTNKLNDLSDKLMNAGLVEDPKVFVKQASEGPEVFLDILHKVSTPKKEAKPLIKLGAAQKRGRIQKGRRTDSEADQYLLRTFGIIS